MPQKVTDEQVKIYFNRILAKAALLQKYHERAEEGTVKQRQQKREEFAAAIENLINTLVYVRKALIQGVPSKPETCEINEFLDELKGA
jgi:Tfp pilus assembly protein PilO